MWAKRWLPLLWSETGSRWAWVRLYWMSRPSEARRSRCECEALCGRIGVMVDGTLRCVGPIQALKSTYGQGYKLDLHLDVARADPEGLFDLLCRRHDGVELQELELPSMVLIVPQAATKLSELFGLLAELKNSCHVVEGSITQCTLEQIFIQMASKTKMRLRAPAA